MRVRCRREPMGRSTAGPAPAGSRLSAIEMPKWRNGRRAAFRAQCPLRTWEFKSPLRHHSLPTSPPLVRQAQHERIYPRRPRAAMPACGIMHPSP